MICGTHCATLGTFLGSDMGLSPAGAERFSFDSSTATAADTETPADAAASTDASAALALDAEPLVAFSPADAEDEDADDDVDVAAPEPATDAASREFAWSLRPEVCAAVARSMSASVGGFKPALRPAAAELEELPLELELELELDDETAPALGCA